MQLGTHALPWIGVAAVLAGAVALGRLVERHMRTSPYFTLRHVRIEGTERLDPEELREAAGLLRGRNVFELSPGRVERALRAHPWIAEAHVHRSLPDTIEVRVRERHAVAAALRQGDVWLLDVTGAPFVQAPPGEKVDLPVVTGLAWNQPKRLHAQLRRAVALVSDWRTMGLARRAQLAEVHFEPADVLSLWLARPRLRVELAATEDRRRLRLLRRALDRIQRERIPARSLALNHERHPRRVVVRLAQEASPSGS